MESNDSRIFTCIKAMGKWVTSHTIRAKANLCEALQTASLDMHHMPWQEGTFGLAFLSWGIYILDTLQMLMEYCLCVGIVSRKLTKADVIPLPVVLTNQWKGEGRESTTLAFCSKRMKNAWWWGRNCSWWEDFLRREKSRSHWMHKEVHWAIIYCYDIWSSMTT